MDPLNLGIMIFLTQLRPWNYAVAQAKEAAGDEGADAIRRGYQSLFGHLQQRALAGESPPEEQRELEHALGNALSRAALFFAYHFHDPQRKLLRETLLENVSWSALRALKARLVELAKQNITVEKSEDQWIHALIERARDPANFKNFNLPSALTADAVSIVNGEKVLADSIHDEFLKWIPAPGVSLSTAIVPGEFKDQVRNGIELADGRRLTFYDAFRLFFREELSRDTSTHRTYVVDALAAIPSAVSAIAADIPSATVRQQFQDTVEALKDFDRFRDQLEDHNWMLMEGVSAIESKVDYIIGGIRLEPFGKTEAREKYELLKARSLAVKLVGRHAEREALWEWLRSSPRVSAQLIVGGAGSGKTRLAFELLESVRTQLPHWRAGLLNGKELERFVETRLGDLHWGRPTLVVVDYAQAVSEPLSHLLGVLMAKRSELLPPLRVLLLERHAGEWFQTLARKEDSNRKPIGELFNPDSNRGWVQEPPYMTLKPITDTDLRRDLFDQTLSQAERIAGTLSPPADASDYSDLARDIFGDPLNVMLAAVAAVDIGVPRALEAGRLDLANDVANKELRLLDRFAPEERYQRVLRHMAACATLESGFDEQGLDRAIDEELAALKRNWVGGEGDLADVLRRVFPDSNNAVAPVTPDLVGEALVLLVLAARERRRGWPEVVSRCAARAPQKTPYTLLKAFQNFWDQADSGEVLLDAVLTIVAGAKDASHLLTAIEHALPDENAQAIDMTRRLYEFLKRSPTQKPDFARIAYNLGVRLHQQGRTGEALDVTQDAVISYSELNERDPAFALQLAEAHGHLATCLGNVGRHHEAYDHACIAVEVYRKLAPLRRQEIEPNLARALDNFANHSAALGRHAEAVALAGEAFTLWRELSRSLRAELLPDLARSSGNFANHLMIAGRDVEAMDAARESLTIYRELDLAYPRNNHKPAVAASLARLGRLQQLTGLLEAAVESYHSGIEVLKDPFRDSRERYELLMQSLRQNYIDVCVALGREPDDLWLQAVTT